MVEHWSPNIHGSIYQFASGLCYLVFFFLIEEDCDIRFLDPISWDPREFIYLLGLLTSIHKLRFPQPGTSEVASFPFNILG